MSSSAPLNIQIFPTESQFNGQATWKAFKDLVVITASTKGLTAYLHGTLARPTAATMQQKIIVTRASDGTETTTTTSSIQPTAWSSSTPSPEEWDLRERHMTGIIFHNIINPSNFSLTPKDGVAKMWQLLNAQFDGTTLIE